MGQDQCLVNEVSPPTTLGPSFVPAPGPTIGPAPGPSRGNAATMEAMGLATAPAAGPPGGDLVSLFPSLGELGELVLGVMPLANAIRLAWSQRQEPWVRRWLGGYTVAELADAAPDLFEALVGDVVPEGFGVSLAAVAGGGAELAAEGSGGCQAWRVGGGVRFEVSGMFAPGAGLNGGVEVFGVDGVVILGEAGALGAKKPGLLRLAGTIDLRAAVRSMFATDLWADLDRARPARVLVDLLTRGLAGPADYTRVDRVRIEIADVVEASGSVATSLGAKAEGNLSSTQAVGYEDGRTYSEVVLAAEGKLTAAGPVAAAFLAAGLSPENLQLAAVRKVAVRLSGQLEAALGQDLAALDSFTVSVQGEGGNDVVESAELRSIGEAARWLVARLAGSGGDTGQTLAPEALPEVALSRSATPSVKAARLPELQDELGQGRAGMQEGPFYQEVETARVDLRLKATPEAIRRATGGRALPVPEAGPEALVLDLGRLLLARAFGTPMRTDLPVSDEDLDAALPLLAVEYATRVIGVTQKAGGGVNAAVSGKAQAELGWFQRTDLSGEPLAAIRAWFVE